MSPVSPAVAAAPAAAKKSRWPAWVVGGVLVFVGLGAVGILASDGPPVARPDYEPTTFSNGVATMHFAWEFKGSEWTWEPQISQEVYDYFKNLDRKRYNYDFAAFVTDTRDDALIDGIAGKIRAAAAKDGYSELEILNFALAFVQSLPYATDDVSTGFNEYPRYPVETLVDPGSDCEDTSILFASLVLKLGYSAVMLSPTGHMAVGVAGTGLPGTYVAYGGTNYYYAETTGDGFTIGDAPPEYRGATMKVYTLGAPAPLPTTSAPLPSHAPTLPTYAPAYVPTNHALATSQILAVAADSVAWHRFQVTSGTVRVDFSFQRTDQSGLDIGIVRDQDLAEYQVGETVSGWAFHNNVASASDSATLGVGTYDLVFYCRNAFADCDIVYTLGMVY